MKISHIYLQIREFKINNGKLMSFLLDPLVDDKPLCQNANWVIRFKIRIQGIIREQQYELAVRLNEVSLSEEEDLVIWKWTANKKNSVKSVYEHQTIDYRGPFYNRISKAKILEKIKIFMWLVEQKSILTKDNLIRRKCGIPSLSKNG
jgi:hypothetical protein